MSRNSLFELITQDAAELTALRLKSSLTALIGLAIEEKGWTQAHAAAVMGISQPRMSNMISGKLNLFSIDTLLKCLVKTGYRLDVKFMPQNEPMPLSINVYPVPAVPGVDAPDLAPTLRPEGQTDLLTQAKRVHRQPRV